MVKIAIIGAGSVKFTRKLVRDILSYPALSDCTLALMDIDEINLAMAKSAVDRIVEAGNYPARVIATKDRVEALRDADGVLCTIQVGSLEALRADLEIPMKFGVNINIGDTRGSAGIFRFIRTLPVMLEICKDMERYCPEAIFLNYTNPMAMLCRAMQSESKLRIMGLCHSVQGTARMLARWLGSPEEELTYLCAGINHQAWFLDFKWNGKDMYPVLKEMVKTPEIYNQEQVRNEMLLHLGYYVTESSGHNSEYNPWFRKRQDLLEKYCTHGTGNNPGHPLRVLSNYEKGDHWRQEEFKQWEQQPIDLNRGFEFASSIFNAVLGDGTMYEFSGNVRNFGLIDNLPWGSCVEVPVIASRRGFNPIHVGSLPPQLALLNDINARCDELAVEGALTGDPRKIFHAICYDPLTSAVLSLEEIQQMVNEMFAASREWLPQFRHLT